jgi:hypothetical protein
MAKRLGEVLALLGWLIGAAILWICYHQADGDVGPLWLVWGFAAAPVIVGHMAYYVLAGKWKASEGE